MPASGDKKVTRPHTYASAANACTALKLVTDKCIMPPAHKIEFTHKHGLLNQISHAQ